MMVFLDDERVCLYCSLLACMTPESRGRIPWESLGSSSESQDEVERRSSLESVVLYHLLVIPARDNLISKAFQGNC